MRARPKESPKRLRATRARRSLHLLVYPSVWLALTLVVAGELPSMRVRASDAVVRSHGWLASQYLAGTRQLIAHNSSAEAYEVKSGLGGRPPRLDSNFFDEQGVLDSDLWRHASVRHVAQRLARMHTHNAALNEWAQAVRRVADARESLHAKTGSMARERAQRALRQSVEELRKVEARLVGVHEVTDWSQFPPSRVRDEDLVTRANRPWYEIATLRERDDPRFWEFHDALQDELHLRAKIHRTMATDEVAAVSAGRAVRFSPHLVELEWQLREARQRVAQARAGFRKAAKKVDMPPKPLWTERGFTVGSASRLAPSFDPPSPGRNKSIEGLFAEQHERVQARRLLDLLGGGTVDGLGTHRGIDVLYRATPEGAAVPISFKWHDTVHIEDVLEVALDNAGKIAEARVSGAGYYAILDNILGADLQRVLAASETDWLARIHGQKAISRFIYEGRDGLVVVDRTGALRFTPRPE